MDVVEFVAGNITKAYLLREMMSKVHLPFDELAAAQVVALEVPPRMPQHFERTLLQFITKVRARGPHVAIVVAPQAKRQSQVALWIHKWNHLEQAPFKFKRQCSCQIGGRRTCTSPCSLEAA